MSQETLIERVEQESKKSVGARWSQHKDDAWPALAVKLPPESAAVFSWIAEISRSSKSAVARNILLSWIKESFGDTPLSELRAIYDKTSDKRTFRNRIWAAIKGQEASE